jgi:hypothetical protein
VEELVQLVTKTYGLIGLILLSPLIAMIYLWKHTQKLQDDLKVANQSVVEAERRVNEATIKRVEDAKSIVEKLMEVSAEHASLSKETNLALDRVGDTLSIIQNGGFQNSRPPRQG